MALIESVSSRNLASAGLVLFFALVFYSIIAGRKSSVPKGLRPPPSPAGARLVGGHAHLWSGNATSNPSETQIVKWAREYGEIYQVRLGTQTWVVLSSPEAVKAVFDKNGSATASKAPARVAMDVLSGGYRMLFMPYGARWRAIRTVVHQCLTVKSADKMKPSQDLESRRYLYDLLNDPANFLNHVKRYASSVMMYATYGRRVVSLDDPTYRNIFDETLIFGHAFGTRFLVDSYPILEKLPKRLQWWRIKYDPFHQKEVKLWMGLWNGLKEQLAAGIRTGCFVEKFMEVDYPRMGISEVQAAYVAGTMIEAGSDSTQNTLNSLILGLVAFPETVKKAHDEIDRVVGNRMPQFNDSPQMPYIRAMVKEALRWRSVSNDHFQHLSTGDVQYKDYFIPAGSVVVGNTWALHFDPTLFPEPERFNPDRYLGTRANELNAGECINAVDPRNRDHWSFGAGRRACPGYTLAENSLFLLTARLLWAFDVQAPTDKRTGERLKYDLWDYPPRQLFGPAPFKVDFKVRDSDKEKMIIDGFKSFGEI